MKSKFLYGAGLLILFAVSLGASYMFFWSDPDWRTNADTASHGIDPDGNPWIGAKNPKLVIHEYLDYACPHCPAAHRLLRSKIAKHLDRIRLVRHDYARRRCVVEQANHKIEKYCPLVRAAYCASKQISYWQWNDAAVEAPPFELNMAYPEYIQHMLKKENLSKDKFEKCYDSKDAAMKAQQFYEDARKARVSGTPTYIVDGQAYTLSGVLKIISENH